MSNSHSQIDALSSLEYFYKNRLAELETKNINQEGVKRREEGRERRVEEREKREEEHG